MTLFWLKNVENEIEASCFRVVGSSSFMLRKFSQTVHCTG